VPRLLALTAVIWTLLIAPAAASFPPTGFSDLTVARTGQQLGTITDSEGEIDCGLDCSGSYRIPCLEGTVDDCAEPGDAIPVTLTATVPEGFQVIWSASCKEGAHTSNPCTVRSDGFVTANFDDPTAPGVSATGPASGPERGTIALSATASDDQTGIAKVQFLVGATLAGEDTDAPYSVAFDTHGVSDGAQTVTARAVNNDGDTADSTVDITADNTAPGLTVGGPDGQTFGPHTTQTWTLAANDATTGPPAVQCSLTAPGAPAAFGPCSPGGGTESVSDKPGGAYLLRVRATDGAGNTREVARTFAIDATPADTTITGGPADGSSSTATSVSFTFSASESGSTFRCRVHPSALTPGPFEACSGAGTHTASGFAPGSYTFEVVATDAVGNSDPTPATRTFTVLGGGVSPTGGGGPGGGSGGPGGGVVAGQRIDALVRTFFTRFGRRTRVDRLTVVGAPQGARVTLTCKGKHGACPFKRRQLSFHGRSLKLAPRFKHRKLRTGTVLTIVVSKPGLVAKAFRYTVRRNKFPAVRIS
jgi:hypothetical protein